jgi:hypothetical protein
MCSDFGEQPTVLRHLKWRAMIIATNKVARISTHDVPVPEKF